MRKYLCNYLCSCSKSTVHPAQPLDIAHETRADNMASGSLRTSSKKSQPDFQNSLSVHLLIFAALILFGGIPAMWIVTSIDNASTLCWVKAGLVTVLLLAASMLLMYTHRLLHRNLTPYIKKNSLHSKQFFAYLFMSAAMSLNQIVETASHDPDGVFLPNRGFVTLCLLPYWYALLCADSRPDYSAILMIIAFASIVASGSFLSSKGFTQCVASAVVYVIMTASMLLCFFMQRTNFPCMRQPSALKTHENSDNEINQEKNVKKLQSDLEEMRYILTNVAHDLKTPLSAIMTGGDLLASGLSSMLQTPLAKRHSQLIDQLSRLSCTQSNVAHTNYMMLSVIHRVEDYARLSRGQELVPSLETVDLHAAITEPIDCLTELQKTVQITFQRLPANVSRYIITDKQWLEENLLCLISNAVKYSDSGEVQVQVCLASDNGGFQLSQGDSDSSQSDHNNTKYLRIEVQDNGVITDEMMTQIFQPNAQQTRSSGGTGLGLYCLAKRIEALHGQFGVNRVARGSVFWFQLPYREDPEAPAPLPDAKIFSNKFSTTVEDLYVANSTSTRVDDGHSLFLVPDHVFSDDEVDQEDLRVEEVVSKSATLVPPMKILVVDDSMPIIKMTSMQMRNQGHIVSTAKHGAEAVQLIIDNAAEGKRFDVILMDLQMPVMDGCEAAIRIRAWEESRQHRTDVTEGPSDRLIIIGNTAFDHEEALATAASAGMDCVLTKPLKIDRFYKAVQNVKDSRQTA